MQIVVKMKRSLLGFCCGFPFPGTDCSNPGKVCTGYFSSNPHSLTCQSHAQASCYVDLPATSAEPQPFPPFDAPSSPEEASSAVGSLESLICDVNFSEVDILTIHFLDQKQINRVFHLVDSCRFSHPDAKKNNLKLTCS